jgi:hypothetical protein
MNAMKFTACVCIFSTLFMGCYSSTMISPTGDDKEKMHTDRIQHIITKDGSKYDFDTDTPPVISNDSFVGVEKKWPVSIPLSSVSKTYSEGKIQFVVTNDSTKYQFDNPFTISNDVIVGDVTNKPVSIPLSEVVEVRVTKFNVVGTVVLVGVTVLVVGGLILVGSAASGATAGTAQFLSLFGHK